MSGNRPFVLCTQTLRLRQLRPGRAVRPDAEPRAVAAVGVPELDGGLAFGFRADREDGSEVAGGVPDVDAGRAVGAVGDAEAVVFGDVPELEAGAAVGPGAEGGAR